MLACVLEQAESHLIVSFAAQSAVLSPKSCGAGQQASSLTPVPQKHQTLGGNEESTQLLDVRRWAWLPIPHHHLLSLTVTCDDE